MTCSDFIYLSREDKSEIMAVLPSVPVTEPGTGSG